MSEYGIKILNYSAGSIFEVDQGVRYRYDTKNAMLTNSLFKDFLVENGLKVWKGESTRDIICIEFKYGSRSFEDELKHINKLAKQNRIDRKRIKSHGIKWQIEEIQNKKHQIARLRKQAELNQDKYVRKTADELREDFYVNGVNIKYPKYNKKTNKYDYEVVHYKMLYRTPGKAKKGSCMFVRSSLYKKAHNFLWMGIKLPKKNAPIVEIGAYSSLITSSIEGRVKIEPENILVLKDVDSFFNTKVLSIELDNEKHCHAIERDNYEVKNTLFDGQALIDTGVFPEWGNGYVLLRHHFFKAAAFHTRIQDFFRDYFGNQYDTATVTDMWGNEHLAKNIKLITTDNACKWLKFPITYEYWSDRVRENGCQFGIVKTAHISKLGDKQRMSYQMVNALNIDSMPNILRDSIDYVGKLKNDDNAFFDYLRKNQNFSNDYVVLLALCEQNPDFINCDYFRERRTDIIYSYMKEIKVGHILQNADNLVIVGNPYGMLMHSVGEDALSDPTFDHEDGCIQCYTGRFADDEYLAFFRSPYNSQNNMLYLHNHYHEYLTKYFDLGTQILVINMVGTDAQDRGNGMDMDSDQGFVTNQKDIVEHAKYCYKQYPTVVNNIPKEKNIYTRDIINFAIIDNALSAAQLDIGESSNVAQIGLSYTYNDFGKDFVGYVAILAVLAQCAIDNCKRRFDVNIHSEIQRIKEEMNIKEFGYPAFMGEIKPEIRKKVNPNIVCPMNSAFKVKTKRKVYDTSPIPIAEFFTPQPNIENIKKSKAVEKLIEKYTLKLKQQRECINPAYTNMDFDEWFVLRSDYDSLLEDLRKITLPQKYAGLMSWLINRAFIITPNMKSNRNNINTKLSKNRSILLKILYDLNPKTLLKCFKTQTTGGK